MNTALIHAEVITDVRKQASFYDALGDIIWSTINGMTQLGKGIFYVLTYRCIQCGQSLDDHACYGLECETCRHE